MHMAPGPSSWKSLILENLPQGGEEEEPSVSCISHQVSLMCLLEGRPICTWKRLLVDFQVPTPSCGFLRNLSGDRKDWVIHTDREQMAGRGWWLCASAVDTVFPRH